MVIQTQVQYWGEEHSFGQTQGVIVMSHSGPKTHIQLYQLPPLPIIHTQSSSNLTILWISRVFPAPRALHRLLLLNGMAQPSLLDPPETTYLSAKANPHSTFREASPLPVRHNNSTEVKNTDMRPNDKSSREAAGKVAMCMDHGARLPGSETCLYNVLTSSVTLDELLHIPVSQFSRYEIG